MSWIEQFVEATSAIPSPELFRKWSGISAVAGALERKVYVRTMGSATYPNLYVILVAPPGVGKTQAVFRVRDLWNALPDHVVAPSSLTKASMIDELDAGKRTITHPDRVPAVTTFNSILIAQNELGVLIPAYDMEFMNTLTDLYDGLSYVESRRSRAKKIEIERSNVNILAACTPAYLGSTLPEGAWDQGFTSRILMIFSGEVILRPLFVEDAEREESYMEALTDELAKIGEMDGEMRFTEDAAQLLEGWHMGGGLPIPVHPKLIHYIGRRTRNALKLCMIASAAEGPSFIITKEHVQQALDWLLEAEMYMPDVFKSMANSSHAEVMRETYHFVYNAYMKGGRKPVSAARLIHFLGERTPAYNVDKMIDIMCRSGLIKSAFPDSGYIPMAREAD